MPAYRDFIGQQAYLKLLKTRFLKPRKNQNTIFLFGKVEVEDSLTLENLLFIITEKHYYKPTYDVKPLTFIIPDENLYTVKSYFIDNDCLINDGYESISFNQKAFEAPAIINKKNNNLTNTSFKVRILSQTTFENLLEFNINGFWVLINTSNHKLINESSYQVLNNLNTKQILNLF